MGPSIFILFFTVLNSFQVMAQARDSLLEKLSLDKIALINQNDSYITFPLDIGNIEPLMFEANLNPSFVIRERKDSKLMALLTPQIIIRMFNEESYPVRTPSYIPQITLYYLVNEGDFDNKTTVFGKIAHHSNGQDGSFYNEDGSINLISGNFSTNYFELGIIKTSSSQRLNAIKVFESSMEVHPTNWMQNELQGQYSAIRWHNSFTTYKLPFINKNTRERPHFSLKIETSLMLDGYADLGDIDIKRLNAGLTFYYHPKFLEDIGLFVQFYHGMDYYNIYFKHRIDTIRFGIMTKILKF